MYLKLNWRILNLWNEKILGQVVVRSIVLRAIFVVSRTRPAQSLPLSILLVSSILTLTGGKQIIASWPNISKDLEPQDPEMGEL